MALVEQELGVGIAAAQGGQGTGNAGHHEGGQDQSPQLHRYRTTERRSDRARPVAILSLCRGLA
jgi:hypothetical protein